MFIYIYKQHVTEQKNIYGFILYVKKSVYVLFALF